MRPAIIAALALVLAALMACGGDDDESSSGDASPTASATTVRTTAAPTDSATAAPSPTQPIPTEITDEIVAAISAYVAATDLFGERRVMTDPPNCDETQTGDGAQFLGKICYIPASYTVEGNEVIVRIGIWASDGVVDAVLRRADNGTWSVAELRDPNDVGASALNEMMIAAIAEYVAKNDMFGERREMTDPPRCGDAFDDALSYAGKVCIVEGTFTVTPQNVLVNAGLWSSDAVLTMVLEQVDESAWAVTEVRE